MRRRALRWLRALTLRTFGMFALALVASLAFVVIAGALRRDALQHSDITIELAVHRLDSALLDVIAKTATFIGSNVIVLSLAGLVTFLAIRHHKRVAAVVMLVDALVVEISDGLLKLAFHRERPRLFDKIALPSDYSFPSGHAMDAMGVYGVIAAVLICIYPDAKKPIAISAGVLIALIGLSRVYLGVHWPSDVLAGFLGGIPFLVASVHLIHRRGAHDRNVADLVAAKGA